MTFQGGHIVEVDAEASESLPRPPGALTSQAFYDACYCCGDCGSVCSQQAIKIDANGYPFLLTPDDCVHCGLCADVCTHGAIEFTRLTRIGLRYSKIRDKNDWGG